MVIKKRRKIASSVNSIFRSATVASFLAALLIGCGSNKEFPHIDEFLAVWHAIYSDHTRGKYGTRELPILTARREIFGPVDSSEEGILTNEQESATLLGAGGAGDSLAYVFQRRVSKSGQNLRNCALTYVHFGDGLTSDELLVFFAAFESAVIAVHSLKGTIESNQLTANQKTNDVVEAFSNLSESTSYDSSGPFIRNGLDLRCWTEQNDIAMVYICSISDGDIETVVSG